MMWLHNSMNRKTKGIVSFQPRTKQGSKKQADIEFIYSKWGTRV